MRGVTRTPLSGGERQRVALARALAPRPALVLLDEPFSSLDADLRLQMREQVRAILQDMQATAIFVTHDQEEALFMGDRLAVFREGQIGQIGAPEEIFHQSATRFVARIHGRERFPRWPCRAPGHRNRNRLAVPAGLRPGLVEVALRADDVDFVPDSGGNATIAARFFRGAFNVYRLRLDSGQVLHAFKEHTCLLPPGARVRAWVRAEHPLAVFPKAE